MRIVTLGAALIAAGLFAGGAYAEGMSKGSSSTTTPSMGASQNGQFCFKPSTGPQNCTFASMEACNSAKGSQSGSCIKNPAATTGSGSSSGSSTMSPPATKK